MEKCKVKLRLHGRPLRRSAGVISNVIRTAIIGQPHDNNPVARVLNRRQQQVIAGSPRTHFARRKKRVYRSPPSRAKNFGPIPGAVTPKKYIPYAGPTPPPKPNTRDVATEIIQHNKLLPKSGTFTRGDKHKQLATKALVRLKEATGSGFHYTSQMILVMLRFVFGLLVHFNWSWTQAIVTTAKLCNVKTNNMFTFAKTYIESDAGMPSELPQKMRGRGSLKFISNHGKDFFSKLKEVAHHSLVHTLCIFYMCTHHTHRNI